MLARTRFDRRIWRAEIGDLSFSQFPINAFCTQVSQGSVEFDLPRPEEGSRRSTARLGAAVLDADAATVP